MKLAVAIFFIGLFLVGCGSEKDTSDHKKKVDTIENLDKNAGIYGYESGMVETHFGATKNKEVLYFDHWGTLSAKYSYTENRSTGTVMLSSIEIIKNETTYLIDPVEKTGLKMTNPFRQNVRGEALKSLEFKEERKLKMLGFYLSGTEVLHGKKCVIYKDESEQMSQTTYVHQGVILKTIINLDGEEITSEATNIQLNIKVPSDKFELPTGINY